MTDLRRRWRSWLGLAIAVGLAFGVVLAVAEIADRTDTTVASYRAVTANDDAYVVWASFVGGPKIDLARVARLPPVQDAGQVVDVTALGLITARGTVARFSDFTFLAPVGDGFGSAVDRPLIESGRAPLSTRADEVMVDRKMAADLDIRVGDVVYARMMTPFQRRPGAMSRLPKVDPRRARGALVRLHVVGIEAWIEEASDQVHGLMIGSPAFLRTFSAHALGFGEDVRLRDGPNGYASFARAMAGLFPSGAAVYWTPSATDAHPVVATIDLQGKLTWLLLVGVAITALTLVLPALHRRGRQSAQDHELLRALGAPPEQRLAAALPGAMVIAVSAAAVAVSFAIAVSPATAVGTAAAYDPRAGLTLDPRLLLVGGLTILALTLIAGVAGSWSALRTNSMATYPRYPPAAALGTAPLPFTLGLRAAFGRGDRAAPVGSALTAAVALTFAVTVGLIVTSSIDRLLTTPRLYGQSMQIVAALGGSTPRQLDRDIAAVRSDPDIATASTAALTEITVGRRQMGLVGTKPVRRGIDLTLIAGHAPRQGEIVLGERSFRSLGLKIGQVIQVRGTGKPISLRVSGEAVLPDVGWSSGYVGLIGGAAVTLRTLEALAPNTPVVRILASVKPDRNPNKVVARLSRGSPGPWFAQLQPSEVLRIVHVRRIPYLLAVTFVLAALATLSYHLSGAIRRRRKEFAILRAVGLEPRTAFFAVVFQAAIWLLVGALIGIPLGVLAGRQLWVYFGQRLGVLAVPVVPSSIALLIPAGVAACLIVAVAPAIHAARSSIADALRAE